MEHMYVYSWGSDETDIRCYGIDENGQSVSLIIPDFTPYVYVELPRGPAKDEALMEVMAAISNLVVYSEVTRKQHLYNNKGQAEFIFCQCASRKTLQQLVQLVRVSKFAGRKLAIHEDSATPVLQMTCLRRVPMATWMSFRGTRVDDEKCKQTSADREYVVSWRNVGPVKDGRERGRVYPQVLAFDLEVNSENANCMPSNKPEDVIFQISCVFQRVNDTDRRKMLLTLNAPDLDDDMLSGIEVLAYDSEEELLIGFINLLTTERPNVLIGYNILMFDISYLMQRCERYSLSQDLMSAGWYRKPAQARTIKWSSSAFRNQEYAFIDWEGILILDLLPIVKRDYKFDNYKLDTVAQMLVGAEKDPVGYKEIFEAYRTNRMARVGKYCVQDSNLCIDLLNHVHAWISLSEMAVVCRTNMFSLYTQGQQSKIYNQVYDYCMQNNIVVTSNGYECAAGERYRGAYVMDPVPGYYENVVPLDFSSLYPSLIIAYNICYSTFVSEKDAATTNPNDYETFEWEDHVGCEHDPKMVEIHTITRQIDALDARIKSLMIKRDALKGDAKKKMQAEINTVRVSQKPLRERRVELKKGKPGEWEDEDGNAVSGVMCAKRKYRFVKRSVRAGVIPTIIQNLLSSRRDVKRQMKTCDPSLAVVLDKKQLAYKVSANSQYGAMGVRRGYLPFMPGAMCVTYLGRESIKRAGELACKNHGAQWIYTDTDSTYVMFPHLTSAAEIWDHAIRTADSISKHFPDDVSIEFEQAIYSKFLILSKKRYTYISCDRDGKSDGKIGKRGIVLARRDNSLLLRTLYAKIVELIFTKESRRTIEEYIIDFINDLYRGVFPSSHYVATKSIRSTNEPDEDGHHLGDYKVKRLPDDPDERKAVLNGKTEREYMIASCPAQVQLAERMKNRGFPIDVGSRMEYVVVNREGNLGSKMEDYEYYVKRRRQFPLDKEYYLRSLIIPIDQLLKVALNSTDFMKRQLEIRKCWRETTRELFKLGGPRICRHRV